jgi:hypothetical protein
MVPRPGEAWRAELKLRQAAGSVRSMLPFDQGHETPRLGIIGSVPRGLKGLGPMEAIGFRAAHPSHGTETNGYHVDTGLEGRSPMEILIAAKSCGGGVATILWIIAAVLVIGGIVTLLRGGIIAGIVLIIVGLLIGPGGVSIFC